MSRKRRRILIILGVLSVLGAGFYYVYFVSTESAVRHAEAFLFSRSKVSQREGQGTYRHFYVTNRVPAAGDTSVDSRFTAERSPELTFGHFDISIRPTLGLGMMLNPTDWFQNEEIRLLDLTALERADFVAELREQVQRSPYGSLLVVVNGFRERFGDALEAGRIGPVVDRVLPLADAPEAHRALEGRATTGKILLRA